jgi:hypothetical protein
MTQAGPATMITEYFWVYLSGILRDHESRAESGASAGGGGRDA